MGEYRIREVELGLFEAQVQKSFFGWKYWINALPVWAYNSYRYKTPGEAERILKYYLKQINFKPKTVETVDKGFK